MSSSGVQRDPTSPNEQAALKVREYTRLVDARFDQRLLDLLGHALHTTHESASVLRELGVGGW